MTLWRYDAMTLQHFDVKKLWRDDVTTLQHYDVKTDIYNATTLQS